jgi:hypothetical protein
MNNLAQHSRRTVVRAAAWTVPAVTVAAAAPAYASSEGSRLVLYSGSTAPVRNLDGTWSVYLSGASIASLGGDIAAGDLGLLVTFEPSLGWDRVGLVTENAVAGTPFGPETVWSQDTGDLLQAWSPSALDAGSLLPLADGAWFSTAESDDVQRGRFVVFATSMGYAPGRYYSEVVPPSVPSLLFDPGSSVVNLAGTATWGFAFDGASITATGGDVAAGELTMTVTWQPDAGFEDQIEVRTLSAPGPAGWDFPYIAYDTAESLVYTLASSATDGNAVSIADGDYFAAYEFEYAQSGRFVITIAAPGFASAVFESDPTPGGPDLAFSPEDTAVVTDELDPAAPWGLDLQGGAYLGGGSAVAGTLRIVVTFETPDGTRLPMSIEPTAVESFTGYEDNSVPVVDTIATWTSTEDFGPGMGISVLFPRGIYVSGTESHDTQVGVFVVTIEADGFPSVEASFPTPGF